MAQIWEKHICKVRTLDIYKESPSNEMPLAAIIIVHKESIISDYRVIDIKKFMNTRYIGNPLRLLKEKILYKFDVLKF